MATVKYDVSGSDPEQATRSFEPPKPGMYVGEVDSVKLGYKDGDKKQPRLEVITRVKKNLKNPKDKTGIGAPLFDYINFSEEQQWRMDQFLQAVGIASKTKRKGTFDTAKAEGVPVRVRVRGETWNDEYRAKPGGYWKAADDDLDDIDLEDEDDVGDEEDEEEEDDETEDETEDEEEEGDDEAISYDADELNSMDLAALKDVVSDLELEPPANVVKKKSTLAPWILENQPNPPSGEDDEEEDDEAEDNYDDTDEWTLAKLKAEAADRDLEIPAKAKRAQIIDLLREDDGADPF